jgi:hypothetical protein
VESGRVFTHCQLTPQPFSEGVSIVTINTLPTQGKGLDLHLQSNISLVFYQGSQPHLFLSLTSLTTNLYINHPKTLNHPCSYIRVYYIFLLGLLARFLSSRIFFFFFFRFSLVYLISSCFLFVTLRHPTSWTMVTSLNPSSHHDKTTNKTHHLLTNLLGPEP